MLRKILLISLIILAPMHSLAALQMPFEHQTGAALIKAVNASQHPCHQDVANTPNDEDRSLTQNAACNACTLCMAFGFSPHHFAMTPDHVPMMFNVIGKTDFISFDSPGLNKPPIL